MNFLGIFLGIGCIVIAMILEGTHPGMMLVLPAFLVVFGTSFFACVVQFPLPTIVGALKCFMWLLVPPRIRLEPQAEFLVGLSTTARQQGLLALENSIGSASDDFTRGGIQMIVDGVDKDSLHQILEQAIAVEEAKYEPYSKFLEAMGGYSPTMGIIGAVLGLIHAMSLLDRPDELGPAIAVAFVATIYGLVLANIICLPAANRIKGIVAEMTLLKYMTLDGLVSIASGENTMMIKRRLEVYSSEKKDAQ
ncbi:MAG: flagellar motor protein [Aeromonadales bacterium]|nr:flagellar motor protein [Aeromonadales bacterium]